MLLLLLPGMHACAGGGITALFPQPAGPRLVLADSRLQVGLYSPLNDEFQLLPGFEGTLQQVGVLQPCMWQLLMLISSAWFRLELSAMLQSTSRHMELASRLPTTLKHGWCMKQR